MMVNVQKIVGKCDTLNDEVVPEKAAQQQCGDGAQLGEHSQQREECLTHT